MAKAYEMTNTENRYEFYMAQFPDFPQVAPRLALKVTREQMGECLVAAYSGASPKMALGTIGLSTDTVARYRKRAEDVQDPYGPVLQMFFDLLEEAHYDGARERQVAGFQAVGDVDEGAEAEPVDPFYRAKVGHEIVSIQEKQTYELNGRKVTRTRHVAPNVRRQARSREDDASLEAEAKQVYAYQIILRGLQDMRRNRSLCLDCKSPTDPTPKAQELGQGTLF